jgi:hypothetical protein
MGESMFSKPRTEVTRRSAGTAKVFPRKCHRKTSTKAGEAYGLGLEEVVVVVESVFVSVLGGGTLVMVFVVVFSLVFSWLAGGFTMVVLVSFLSAAGAAGATSVLCSHAPRSAALAKMQINLFIGLDWLPILGLNL